MDRIFPRYFFLACAWLFLGCVGYRTPLEPGRTTGSVPGRPDGGADAVRDDARDAAPEVGADARTDVARDTRADLPPDTLPDLRQDALPDARTDLPHDALPDARPDLRPDALPDARADLPPDVLPDARADLRPDTLPDGRPDLQRDLQSDLQPDLRPDLRADLAPACPSGQKFVLLLGDDGRMYRFDSSTLAITSLATVACAGQQLNSMTVSPIGPAYISTLSGNLCRVDVATFTSTPTDFNPSLVGTTSYGMALLPDSSAAGQTLYIAVAGTARNVNHLKRINLTTYGLTAINDISPAVDWAELTAGPNGELYGFSVGTSQSLLLNIDPNTGVAIDVTRVPAGFSAASFALVYWQDGFYLFLADGSGSTATVYHYRKGDAEVEELGSVNAAIIGAGVAACP